MSSLIPTLEDQFSALLEASKRESDLVAEADRILTAEIEALRQVWGRLDHLEQVRIRFYQWMTERAPHMLPQIGVGMNGAAIRPPAPHPEMESAVDDLARYLEQKREMMQ